MGFCRDTGLHVSAMQITKSWDTKSSCLSRWIHRFCLEAVYRLIKESLSSQYSLVFEGEKENISSTTNLRLVVFKLSYRKGSHPQEDLQRLIRLFVEKKKGKHTVTMATAEQNTPKSHQSHQHTHLMLENKIGNTASLSPCEAQTLSSHCFFTF